MNQSSLLGKRKDSLSEINVNDLEVNAVNILQSLDVEVAQSTLQTALDGSTILFYVSNKGRVKGVSNKNPTFGTLTRGYFRYGYNYRFFVHAAVCLLFNGMPSTPAQCTVNHIDGNPVNNCSENLEWASYQEQMIHSWSNNPSRKSPTISLAKPVESCKIGLDPEVWTRHLSVQAAADACNTYQGGVSNACTGRAKSAGGYKFRWADTGIASLLDGEEWRQATGKNGALQGWSVSNLGRVKSPTNIISMGSITVDQYFYINCKRTSYPVHQIIAYTFISPPANDFLTVDHLDRNPKNNKVINLRWATKAQQTQNRFISERLGCRIIVKDIAQNKIFNVASFVEASRVSGVSILKIQECFSGTQSNTTNGFEFSFINPDISSEDEQWRSFCVRDAQYLRNLNTLGKNTAQRAKESPALKRYRAQRTEKNKALQEKNKKRKVDNE